MNVCTVFLLLSSQANAHAELFNTVTACEMSTLRAHATTAHGVLWELGCAVEKKASATETMQEQTKGLGGCPVLDSHKRDLAVLCAVHAAALDAKDVRYNAIVYGVNARIQTNCCEQ